MADYLASIVWGGVSREITQPYGPDHRGIDIGLIVGTPLYAARTGQVTRVGYGFLAIAVAGTNQTDWYLHIDSAAVTPWSNVSRGQLVAHSGAKQVPNGPPITGPHLHFEVQTGALDNYSTSLDPVPVLIAAYGAASGGMDDLTPDENYMLKRIDSIASGAHLNGPSLDQYATQTLAAIKALPGGQAALDAIADLKATIQANHATEATALGAAVADLKAHTTVASDPALAALAQDIDDRLKRLTLVVQ